MGRGWGGRVREREVGRKAKKKGGEKKGREIKRSVKDHVNKWK